MWRPALASRFSTTRSTLAASTQATTGSTISSSRRPLLPPLLGDPADQGGQVGGAAPRGHDPLAQPVQVEQVGQQSVQLAGVGHQPVDQVGGVLRGQARPGPLEGQGDADDRGQRGPQLVGDGVQEGVLHVVEGPQLLGRLPLALQRLPLALQRLAQRLLGLLLLGDVDVEALPVVRLSGLAKHQHGMVADPHHPAVLGQDPVLHVPGIPGAVDALVLGQHPLAVVRVDQRLPEVRLGGLLGRVAEQLLVLRALVDDGAAGGVHLGVERRRDLLGQHPVALHVPGSHPCSRARPSGPAASARRARSTMTAASSPQPPSSSDSAWPATRPGSLQATPQPDHRPTGRHGHAQAGLNGLLAEAAADRAEKRPIPRCTTSSPSSSASHSSASRAPTSRAARLTMRSYRSDQASTPMAGTPSCEETPANTLSPSAR